MDDWIWGLALGASLLVVGGYWVVFRRRLKLDRARLEEAQQLALKGVELAEPGKARAQILDTAAEICNALGNCDEAIALIKKAIEDEPTSEYYAEQLTRFEEAASAE